MRQGGDVHDRRGRGGAPLHRGVGRGQGGGDRGAVKNKVQTSYGTTAGFSIFANAENVDAAKAWARFITDPDQMATIPKSGGFISPRSSMIGCTPMTRSCPKSRQYADLMHSGRPPPGGAADSSREGPHIQSAFLGEQSLEDALAAAEEEVNRLLERS